MSHTLFFFFLNFFALATKRLYIFSIRVEAVKAALASLNLLLQIHLAAVADDDRVLWRLVVSHISIVDCLNNR